MWHSDLVDRSIDALSLNLTFVFRRRIEIIVGSCTSVTNAFSASLRSHIDELKISANCREMRGDRVDGKRRTSIDGWLSVRAKIRCFFDQTVKGLNVKNWRIERRKRKKRSAQSHDARRATRKLTQIIEYCREPQISCVCGKIHCRKRQRLFFLWRRKTTCRNFLFHSGYTRDP